MTVHIPAWVRLWMKPDPPTEALAALAEAKSRADEAADLARRAAWHRQHNHFADRIELALSQEARRRKHRKRKK